MRKKINKPWKFKNTPSTKIQTKACYAILTFVPYFIDFKMFVLKELLMWTFLFSFFRHFLAATTVKPTTTPVPTCPTGWIHCNHTSICIKREWLCDGVANCPGYWDELPKNCPSMFLVKFLRVLLKLLVWKHFRIWFVTKFRELSSDRPAVIVRSAYKEGKNPLIRGCKLMGVYIYFLYNSLRNREILTIFIT